MKRDFGRLQYARAFALSLTTLFLFSLGCGSSTPAAEPTPTVDNSTMSRIAFVSKRVGNWEIYVMNADGSDQRNITNNPGLDSHPSWSGDGSRIVFASDRDGDRNIYAMDPDGSNVVRLTDSPGVDHMPALSPDGTKNCLRLRQGRPAEPVGDERRWVRAQEPDAEAGEHPLAVVVTGTGC